MDNFLSALGRMERRVVAMPDRQFAVGRADYAGAIIFHITPRHNLRACGSSRHVARFDSRSTYGLKRNVLIPQSYLAGVLPQITT